MIQKICPQCRKFFETYRIKRAKFCSRLCFGLSNRGKPAIIFTPQIREKIKQARKLQPPPRPKGTMFTEEHKKKLRKQHKDRIGIERGYITTYRSMKRQIPEHRFIAEKILKRFLKKNEIVHHINGIKTDNRPKNLYVCLRNEHPKIHFRGKILIKVKSNLI